MTTIFDVNSCRESSSAIIMGNFIVNNVTKGHGQIYARVLYFIHYHHEVFDNDFQCHRLNAPKSFSNSLYNFLEIPILLANTVTLGIVIIYDRVLIYYDIHNDI